MMLLNRGNPNAWRQLRQNFTSQEFFCKCGLCDLQLISDDLLDRLQRLRNDLGKPIHINSGYRCERYQQQLNEDGLAHVASKSYHCKGMAADISVEGMTGLELLPYLKKHFNGIGVARNWCHADCRVNRARWVYDDLKIEDLKGE